MLKYTIVGACLLINLHANSSFQSFSSVISGRSIYKKAQEEVMQLLIGKYHGLSLHTGEETDYFYPLKKKFAVGMKIYVDTDLLEHKYPFVDHDDQEVRTKLHTLNQDINLQYQVLLEKRKNFLYGAVFLTVITGGIVYGLQHDSLKRTLTTSFFSGVIPLLSALIQYLHACKKKFYYTSLHRYLLEMKTGSTTARERYDAVCNLADFANDDNDTTGISLPVRGSIVVSNQNPLYKKRHNSLPIVTFNREALQALKNYFNVQ